LLTSRFSSGFFFLKYIKGFKRYLFRHLRGVLSRCWTHFGKIREKGLKPALIEEC